MLPSPVVIVAVKNTVGVCTGVKNGAGIIKLADQSTALLLTGFGWKEITPFKNNCPSAN